MNNDSSSEANQQRYRSRRNILKTTGLALGASITGLGAATGSAAAKISLSADMVKPGKPETARKFVRKTVNSDNLKNIRQAYRNLSAKQLDAVRTAFGDLSSSELVVQPASSTQTDGVDATAVTAASQPEGSATYRRSIAGVTAYTFTLRMDFEVQGGTIVVGSVTNYFDRTTPSSLWHYQGLDEGNPGDMTDTSTTYTAIGKFTHSVAGQHLDTEFPKIVLTGHANGSFESTKTLLEQN